MAESTRRYNLRNTKKKPQGVLLNQWEVEYVKLTDNEKRRIPMETVMTAIRSSFEDSGIEQWRTTLKCPLSGQRIKVPARYADCTHIECFDLETFLRMKTQKNLLVCPICQKEVEKPLANLRIDEFIETVLSALPDAMQVELQPDGSFTRVHEEFVAVPNVINVEEPFVQDNNTLSSNVKQEVLDDDNEYITLSDGEDESMEEFGIVDMKPIYLMPLNMDIKPKITSSSVPEQTHSGEDQEIQDQHNAATQKANISRKKRNFSGNETNESETMNNGNDQNCSIGSATIIQYNVKPEPEAVVTSDAKILGEILTVQAKKICRSDAAKRSRLNDKVTSIPTLNKRTLVEVFRFLNYCGLANNSLVTKRFRDLIQTHRHSLALLYVNTIGMSSYPIAPAAIKIFDKELSPEAYNEWVVLNGYSKQDPLRDQLANTQSTQNIPNAYQLYAYAHYKDLSRREWNNRSTVFSAKVEVNHENWPAFQHFVRLITDLFIYIDNIRLTDQNDILDLLTRAINSDHDRLHCNRLYFDLKGNSHQYITWAKDHLRCNQFSIYDDANLSQEALLDFAMTAGQCTSLIIVDYNDVSKAMIDFVQKFLELENWDDYQGVQSIRSAKVAKNRAIQVMKNDYAKFLVKEHKDDDNKTDYAFEFVNDAIGKKLQLTAKTFDNDIDCWDYRFPVSMEILNL